MGMRENCTGLGRTLRAGKSCERWKSVVAIRIEL